MAYGKIRERYQSLPKKELQEKAYELGFNFLKYNYNCSQSTVAAIHELLEIDDSLVKAATSLSGGTAEQFSGTCGSLIGGLMVIGYFVGRPASKLSPSEKKPKNVDALLGSFGPPQKLADRYWKEYGTIICPHIQRRLFGRTWWLLGSDNLVDEDCLSKFEEAGGHTDPNKCLNIVGKTARWVMNILIDEGIVLL